MAKCHLASLAIDWHEFRAHNNNMEMHWCHCMCVDLDLESGKTLVFVVDRVN